MSQLTIRLLGPPQIERDGQPIEVDTRKAIALLAYLALNQAAQRRSSLAALLWPDSDRVHARSALRRTLTALNKAIGKEWMEADRTTIHLPPQDNLFVDVHRFQSLWGSCRATTPAEAQSERCRPLLAEAVALHRGDFLEGFTLADSPGFDEWQFFQAESLRQELAQALQWLISNHHQRHDFTAAIECARRWLALDPLHEPAHQQLIQLYMWSGQRSAAVRQYEECARLLEEELAVEPMPETTALYEQARELRPATAALPQPPTIASAAPPPSRLPRLTTTFIGRDNELDEIAQRLSSPDCRLLTLIGPGGVGKTRLALQFAAEHKAEFRDGVYFVPLGPISSAEFLVSTIADAVHFAFYGREEPWQQLLNFLLEKEMLLVLDNFEHLLAGAELLVTILDQAPGVKMLVTSQERLNLVEEWLLEVQGLACPNGGATQEIERYSAVQLFMQRAQRVQTGFNLNDEERPAVSRICRLVGGTPLGIELASTWVRVLSCQEIAQQIESNLDFLATSLRDVPERHRSLRAVFDYSWQLLADEEQAVFRRLALCRGGFSTAVAEAIAGASLPLLMALTDKSFLRRTDNGRYEIPEVLRQYAQARLEDQPQEIAAVRQRHIDYFVAFLQQRATDLKGGRQKEALAEIGVEIENIRQAWRWLSEAALDTRFADLLGQSVESLFLFYELRSLFQEGEEAMAAAAKPLAPTAGDAGTAEPVARQLWANLLARQAAFNFRLSHYDQARTLLEQSLPLLRSAAAPNRLAFALYYLGILEETAGAYSQAQALQNESRQLYETAGNRWGMAGALNGLGNIAHAQGEYTAAQDYYRQSLALRRAIGDRHGIALCLNNLGNVSHALGNYTEAKQLFRESAALKEEIGDSRGLAFSLNNLGYMAYLLQEYDEAQEYLQASLATFRAVGDRRGSGYALTNLGNIAFDRGQYEAAAAIYRQALATFEAVADRVGIAFSLEDLGNSSHALGDPRAARDFYQRALETAVAIPAIPVALDVVTSLANLLIDEGLPDKARPLLAQVQRHPVSRQQTRDRAEQLLQKAEAMLPATAVVVAGPERTLSLEELLQMTA